MKIIEANGARIPAIGLGTYTLRGSDCIGIVEQALAAGYRHIDTAGMYENEAEVGDGIRRSGVSRDEIFVTTKIWRSDIGADRFLDAAERSVEALGIGAVDLLLIHWPNADIPLEESIEALNAAKARGLTRHIGVANFTSALLDEAVALSEAPLVCNQVEYHPFLDQSAVRAELAEHGMALTAYSPLAKGKVNDEPTIKAIAEKHGKSPTQVTLRWEIQQDGVIAIPRTSKTSRVRDNFDVFDFQLTEEEMAAIGKIGARDGRITSPGWAPAWD